MIKKYSNIDDLVAGDTIVEAGARGKHYIAHAVYYAGYPNEHAVVYVIEGPGDDAQLSVFDDYSINWDATTEANDLTKINVPFHKLSDRMKVRLIEEEHRGAQIEGYNPTWGEWIVVDRPAYYKTADAMFRLAVPLSIMINGVKYSKDKAIKYLSKL